MKRYIGYIIICCCIAGMTACDSKVDFTVPNIPAGQTTDLLISEISTAINTDPAAAGARPHYVEIYNGTGGNIDLSNYAIGYQASLDESTLANWNFTASTYLLLSGSLQNNKCYVISSPQIDAAYVPRDIVWGTTSTTAANASVPLQLSGNSAIALLKKDAAGSYTLRSNNYKIIDVFGSPLVARITSTGAVSSRNNFIWTIAGENGDTRNRTFMRKATVTSPTTDWATSKGTTSSNSQWTISADRAWSYTNVGLPTQ